MTETRSGGGDGKTERQSGQLGKWGCESEKRESLFVFVSEKFLFKVILNLTAFFNTKLKIGECLSLFLIAFTSSWFILIDIIFSFRFLSPISLIFDIFRGYIMKYFKKMKEFHTNIFDFNRKEL